MVRFVSTVEIAPGSNLVGAPSTWRWTDLSMQRFVHDSPIVIQRGRSDRFSEASPDTCSLTLLNDAGRFVPRNPLGPWYGQLTRGTPLRVLIRPNVNSAADAFGRTASSSWGAADSGGTWTVVGTAADYSVSSTNGGRHTHPSANVSHWSTLPFSLVRADVKVRIRVNALSTGASQSAGVMVRYVDSNNSQRGELQFATSGAITARLVSRVSGTDTPGSSFSTGLTHSTSAWYWIRLQTGFTAARVRVWQDGTAEPSTWLIDGSAGAFSVTTAGAFGVFSRRETSNTNASAAIDFDDFNMVDGPRTQFTGFVDAWPVRWNDAGLRQAFAPITASGQLSRISRSQPRRSKIYRSSTINYAGGTPTVVAYWPMEDGSTARSFASAVGGPATTFTGDVRPASDSSVVGSLPLPTFGGSGSVRHQVPAYTATGTWAVRWLMKIPASSLSANAQVMSWMTPTGSPIVRWQMTLAPGSPDVLSLSGWNAANSVVFAGSTVNLVDPTSGAKLANGRQLYFEVNGVQNGGNIDTTWNVWFVPDNGTGANGIGQVQSTASTIGNVSLIYHDAPNGFAGGGHTIGHVGVGNAGGFGAGADGVLGGAGDWTDGRFISLCDELNIPHLFGDLVRGAIFSTPQRMGPQGNGDALQELQLVEATELGTMHDGKLGQLELLPREYRLNRPVDLTLNAAQGQVGWPFEPIDDDYLLRNDVTVTNAGGSSARSTDLTSIQQQGVYADTATVSTYLDSDLQFQADWRKNVGLNNDLRYPAIVVNLTRSHLALANAWCDTDVGSRMQVTNLPAGALPPETLDLIIDGYTETITATEWTAVINASPAKPWLVETLDSDRRLDCAASTTAGSLNTTTTSVAVAIADTCTWTHADGDFGIYVGGELMTVTAVSAPVGSGSSWTQTLTVTRSVNGIVKTHSVGEEVHVASPIILAL